MSISAIQLLQLSMWCVSLTQIVGGQVLCMKPRVGGAGKEGRGEEQDGKWLFHLVSFAFDGTVCVIDAH